MTSKFLISYVILQYFLPNADSLAKLTLYSESLQNPKEIKGSECPYGSSFDTPLTVSCACLTGLWAFYDNKCNSPKIVGAIEEKCVFINQKVEKVHLLSSPDTTQAATYFNKGKGKALGRLEANSPSKSASNSDLAHIILSNGPNAWGLVPETSCIGKITTNEVYCEYLYDGRSNVTKLEPECTSPTAKFIAPSSCFPYVHATSSECSAYDKTKSLPSEDISQQKTRPQQGRVFLRARGNGTENGTDSSNNKPSEGGGSGGTEEGNNGTLAEYHENHNFTVNITYPEINSEIWNYITAKGQEILNLTTPIVKTPLTPTFNFLELSKQIMKKACPDHYVKDGHFDLATQVFINLQKKVFQFNDYFNDHSAKLRIEDSLNLCLQNITAYPFVDPLNRTGNCNETIEPGTFDKFGKLIELNVSWASSGREREPLIETVWKIFTHAHAACYNFFDEAGYNDHHRYASAIFPMFINGINDIWKSMSELSEDTYSELLGDPIKLMDGVTFCAEFPKLETEYPWELPRPEKELNNRRRRRKRRSTQDLVCLKHAFDNECHST